MAEHGEYIRQGPWAHSRWCAVCARHHGPLFPCGHYPPEVLEEVRRDGERFRRDLADPEWCRRQLAKGAPAESIAVMRLFAEIE